MTGFTPGPWEATERNDYQEIIGPRERADWYGRKGVWAVAYADTDRDEDEQIANARLIAAAPDLLEALDAIAGYPDIRQHVGSIIHDRALAAIAKATTA